ncbi:MAG TPA: SpoIIE family protein phosphatase [Vicinamibacteria bacterium]|nr:SpoIIE family protein phosphatase [Vicinamibacteria bacterium]
MAELPVVFQYQRALDEFRREGREPPLLKRMSELISLLDLTTTLNSPLSSEEILDAALLIVLGELQSPRGALLVREEDGRFRVRAARGLAPAAPRDFAAEPEAAAGLGLSLVCPVEKRGRTIALIGLGPRSDGRPFGEDERGFLRSVAACAATPIENGLIYHELRQLNQRLSVKVFQLHNLFDISRELTASFDEETIQNLVTTTLMGHLMVSRAAMYLATPEGFVLVHERGPRSEEPPLLEPAAAGLAGTLRMPTAVAELPESPLRERLQRARMALVVPLRVGERSEGFLAVGERASGAPFSEEDRDFAMTLARQALAALESVRLHRVRVEKQRQDREMQIAREIQQSLFPQERPVVPGFEVAACSRPCYHVGGDHYDFIGLPDGRLALGIADVSGKGAPASILMASVHASLRALAGTARPQELAARLNQFLYESTQPNKYVTLVYAELDPVARRLRYVNAGHIPPYLVRADGSCGRLTDGGPALGLIEDAPYDAGEVTLAPGDLVAMVTDGATEAASESGEEFGDARIESALRGCAGRSAGFALDALMGAVTSWTGAAGCSDDLTVLTLKSEGETRAA